MSQDARCWYYRGGWKCYRAGGNICFADTPTAINREHAILGADRCVAVNPSDSAPALIALDAQMVIRNAQGERVVNAEDYFIGPATDITRMTVLKPGRPADGDPHPRHLGGRAVLFRESPRPRGLGLPAGEHRLGGGVHGRQDRTHPHRRRTAWPRIRCASAEGGGGHPRQTSQ